MPVLRTDPVYERWRWRIFGITWLAYAGFYFTRKGFSVAKLEPLWAPDGSELFFRNGSQIMVVDVALGDTFSLGAPRPLVSTFLEDDVNGDRSYDVMPDGRSFVIIRSDPTTEPELRVIKGWVDELMGRLKRGS